MAAVNLPGALNGGWLVNPGNSFRQAAVAMAYCSGSPAVAGDDRGFR